MTQHMPEPDSTSELEDEGIPDLEDSTPERQWAGDPERPPVPGDTPLAVDDYGTTPAEQRAGEGLDRRLAREQPEPDPGAEWPGRPGEPPGQDPDTGRPAGRLVAPSEGARPDAEPDEVAQEAGPDFGGYSAEEAAMRVEPAGEAATNAEPE